MKGNHRITFINPRGAEEGAGTVEVTWRSKTRAEAIAGAKHWVWTLMASPHFICTYDGTTGTTPPPQEKTR